MGVKQAVLLLSITLAATGNSTPISAKSIEQAKLKNGRLWVKHDNKSVPLTLVPELQEKSMKILRQARAVEGAIVVMRPDGEIIAMAGRLQQGKEDASLATRVWAPAASIFKLVTATALVNSGVSPEDPICYHGGLRSIQKSNLHDDPKRDGRCGDLAMGVSHSQNAIIAKLVNRFLPRSKLLTIAKKFGFHHSIHSQANIKYQFGSVELPTKALPFARVAAGFWKSHLSPLGAAVLTNTIASGGKLVAPHIFGEKSTAIRVLPRLTAEKVTQMMISTTTVGTARKGFRDRRGRPFLPNHSVAGKTGTLTQQDPYKQFSWFTGFAPAENPKYVVSVLLANPPVWHLKAHSAARMILQEALAKKY